MQRPKAAVTATRLFIGMMLAGSFLSGCASSVLKADNSQSILKTDEFDKAIAIKEIETPDANQSGTYVRLPGPTPDPTAFPAPVAESKSSSKKKSKAGNTAIVANKEGLAAVVAKNASKPLVGRKTKNGTVLVSTETPATTIVAPSAAPAAPGAREPSIEDKEGFNGRRPIADPFRVNEKVTLEVSYFGVVAGDMTVEVKPFVEVNGRKSYHYYGRAQSTSVFAMFTRSMIASIALSITKLSSHQATLCM